MFIYIYDAAKVASERFRFSFLKRTAFDTIRRTRVLKFWAIKTELEIANLTFKSFQNDSFFKTATATLKRWHLLRVSFCGSNHLLEWFQDESLIMRLFANSPFGLQAMQRLQATVDQFSISI